MSTATSTPACVIPFTDWAASFAAATTGVASVGNVVTITAGTSRRRQPPSSWAPALRLRQRKCNPRKQPGHRLPARTGWRRLRPSGMFAGASGTYSCTGTCSFCSGRQRRRRDPGGCRLDVHRQQRPCADGAPGRTSEYQHFGWWLRKADSRAIQRAPYSPASMGTDDRPITGIRVGWRDRRRTPDRQQGSTASTIRARRAATSPLMVELKANFGGTGTGSEGTISGTVDNFMGDTDRHGHLGW